MAPNRWLSDIPRNDVFFKIPLPDTIDEINSSSVISNARILGLDDFLQKSVNFDGSSLSPDYLPSLLSSSKAPDQNSFIKQNGTTTSYNWFLPCFQGHSYTNQLLVNYRERDNSSIFEEDRSLS